METIEKYAKAPNLSPLHPVIQSHQKSAGGNEKIIYYILTKYHMPEKFEDFVYLSQRLSKPQLKVGGVWNAQVGGAYSMSKGSLLGN